MLDESITLSFSEDGVAAATDHVFKKKAHELNSALYRSEQVILDPGLPDQRIAIMTEEPKPNAAYYGTRRTRVNQRHNYEISTPTGTGMYPVVFKFESSIPVGISGSEIMYELGQFNALILHDIFTRLVRTQET